MKKLIKLFKKYFYLEPYNGIRESFKKCLDSDPMFKSSIRQEILTVLSRNARYSDARLNASQLQIAEEIINNVFRKVN